MIPDLEFIRPRLKQKMETVDSLNGLALYKDFITQEEADMLIKEIDAREWAGLGVSPNPELKRRTQQYGCVFSYRYREIMDNEAPEIPKFVTFLFDRFRERNVLEEDDMPNSLIVNEYEVGQGIMPHIDAPAIFGKVIMSLSLLSDCAMFFCKGRALTPEDSIAVHLPKNSLICLKEESRYDWNHSISKDAIDKVGDLEIHRSRRVSLTFRKFVTHKKLALL